MDLSTYFELFIFTAGTLIYLFLAVLLAGLRRPRLLESLVFLSGVCLFLFYSGHLLSRNIGLYYGPEAPRATVLVALALETVGLALLPPLLVHAHTEFFWRLKGSGRGAWLVALSVLGYLSLATAVGLSLIRTGHVYELYAFAVYFAWSVPCAFALAAVFEWRFARHVTQRDQARLHDALSVFFGISGLLCIPALIVGDLPLAFPYLLRWIDIALYASLLFPGFVLGYFMIRQRFLPLGVQRHLVFTVTAAFLALIYLTLALRISAWLEDYLPPVATLSILLFVLVIFFEPLQRRVGTVLGRAFRQEAERLQKLTAEIQHVARTGNVNELVTYAEARLKENFALADARVVLPGAVERPLIPSSRVQKFPLRSGPEEIGAIEAHFFGQTLSGETFAALTYLGEQLPAALDLCRLIDEKLRLERELAERERLALVGQMAASISHNLKNPLSSMKTLLQVKLENPKLPAPIRKDCGLVVEEIDRLSAKLGQLLQFARPAVRSGVGQLKVGVVALAEQTVNLLRHEAERQGVVLEFVRPATEMFVAGSESAVSDILTNLLVNAIEALAGGGNVRVSLSERDANAVIEIIDDGPGIPPEQQAKIFQPFYTTKTRGTGLGLAIVERRLAELKGTITCTSPVENSRGTRFTLTLPLAS